MTDLKKDKAKTAKIVLPQTLKNKYSKRRYDFAGYDTKEGKSMKPLKVRKGKRGGTYVIKKGKKHYLRK